MSRGFVLSASVLVAAVLTTACLFNDQAEREYLAALRGDEDGSTEAQRLAHVERAIALAPHRPQYWEYRADVRHGHLQLELAEADFTQAITLADRPYPRYQRGIVRARRGHLADAMSDLDQAIAAQPDNAQFYNARALAHLALGQVEQALADGETLVRLAPQVGNSYYARGLALAALGRHAQAVADFDEALRRRPELVFPLEARSRSLEALGDPAGAARDRAEHARRRTSVPAFSYVVDHWRF